MTNVDKAESIASPKISSSIPLISMWVLLEGNPSSVKINVNPSDFASQRPDLNDLKPILKEEFDELKNVAKGKIEFFADKDRTQSLLSDVALATLKTNASSPLIVRYPLSTSSIVVTYKYGNSKESYEMPHFGGSWSLLQEDVMESFRSLSKFENAQARDVYFEIPDRENKKIKNEFQFNALVIQTEVNEGKRVLPEFKVFIKGKKPYSEWEINDVLREILHQDSISDLQTFDLNDLPESKLLTEEELNLFVDVIQQTLYVFKNKVDVNEATTREYISTFMKTAVRHIQTYTNGTAELFVEDNLNGTRGYGPVDYLVKLSNTAVLVNEAKTNNITKGLAQTITQLHTMREKLGKRKLGQTEFESSPLFGIVSTGNQWLFVRWTGSVESPTVEISKKISCEFVGSMQNAKDVASYIVRILQTQNDEFQKNNLKRVRIDQGSS